LEEKLHLVVVGLYADDVISHGASTEDCLIAVLRSLVSFKDVYPNWDDAYSVAHSVLVDGRNRIWNCLAAHQRVVEADMWPEQTEVDSRTCQPLEARVASFFGYAKICAAGSLGPCRELAPHLWEAISAGGPTPLSIEAKLFTWEFLHLVALSWWAARAASLEFAEVDARSVKRLLCHQLENWNPGTSKAFSDLDKFVLHADAYLRTLKDENEKLKVVQTSVGTWLLWNLTAKATFRDERRLAAMLGGTTYQFTGGYWNSAVDRASSAKSPPQRK
jgi:hypothetical protein